jgi:hypothetical protein
MKNLQYLYTALCLAIYTNCSHVTTTNWFKQLQIFRLINFDTQQFSMLTSNNDQQ